MTTHHKKDGAGARVAVIGGGIAGITAAIKLHQQGYEVTLFEKAAQLGGNLSSNSKDQCGRPRDVYPHIFAEWYNEFWYLLEQDLGLSRDELFERRPRVQMGMLPQKWKKDPEGFGGVKFESLTTASSLTNLVENCQGEILSPRDMFLFGYSYLDLVSAPNERKRSKLLSDLDITGYLYSRPYMNDEVAGLHDDILKVIWSMPSDQTAATAHQKLLRHTMTFPHETPFAWLLKGSLETKLMAKVRKRLEKALTKERVKMRTDVKRLMLDEKDECAVVHWNNLDENGAAIADGMERFRYVVIATPPKVAADLAIQSTGANLAKRHPMLARLREADMGRIPVVYLFLGEELWTEIDKIPSDITGFKRRGRSSEDPSRGSTSGNYDISMLKLNGLWDVECLQAIGQTDPAQPVLVIAASHAEAIETPGPGEHGFDGGEAQGHAMLKRLSEYFPFIKVGDKWGQGSGVDWKKTHVVSNNDHQLFLNTVAANQWRPHASLRYYKRASDTQACRNVVFAGDYCMTAVDMATVEAAVQSGVWAARAIMDDHGLDAENLPLQPHRLHTPSALTLAKLIAAPAAFAAAVSAMYDDADDDPVRAVTLPTSTAVLAVSYWADWVRTAQHLWRLQIPGYRRSPHKQWDWRDVHPQDETVGVLEMMADLALAVAVEGPRVGPQIRDDVAEALYQGWRQSIGRIYFPNLPDKLRDPDVPKRLRTWERNSIHRKPDEAPAAWSDIFGTKPNSGQVAKAVSSTAFGAVAAGAHFVDLLVKEADNRRQNKKAEGIGDLALKAVWHGLEAKKRKATGRRYYNTPYRLSGAQGTK